MEYLVLRSCYVGERLYKKGEVHELPKSLEKSPDNFRPLGIPEAEAEAEEPLDSGFEEELMEKREMVDSLLEPKLEGIYFCIGCGKNHNVTSKIGKKHLKYKKK